MSDTISRWPEARLGDVTSIGSGAGFPNKYQGVREAEFPFYKVSDMNLPGNEVRMLVHNNAIDEATLNKLKAKAHPPGTIIFPKIGAAIATNKKRVLTKPACFDNNVIGIHPSPAFDTQYMYHLMLRTDLSDFANTGNPPSIRKTTLEVWKFPLPPLEEQRRIAAILDAADVLRAKRRDALAQLDALLQATFLDMFGDPVTNPKGWEVTHLPKIAIKFADGPFGSNLKSSHYVDDGVRVIRLQNIGVGEMLNDDVAFISKEHYTTLPRNHCLPGDIVIGTLGDPNLRACIIPKHLLESLNKADCLQLRVDGSRADRQYVCWMLNCRAMVNKALELVRGQTRGRISMGRLKELQIPLPPLDLQRHFAAIAESVEQQKGRYRAQLDELDALFASLQHWAFNGELS